MKPTSDLDEIMDELRHEHRAVEAPRQLEVLLSAETGRKVGPSRVAPPRRALAWGLSLLLLAGALWGVAAWKMRRPHSPGEQQAGAMAHTAPIPPPQQQTLASAPLASLRRGGHSVARHALTSAARGESQPNFQEDSMGDFVLLPASEGLPPASAISLVRMQIQQSALQQYGLEVPAEAAPKTLLAEFAVGEDGLPRAIRIIP